LKTVKRRRKADSAKRTTKRKAVEAEDDWLGTLFGSFLFAFVAVLRKDGWKCWLHCWGVMTALPIVTFIFGFVLVCVPFFGPIILSFLLIITASAAPAGLISRNVELASRYGVNKKMQNWQMEILGEMVPSSIEFVKAASVMVFLPVIAVLVVTFLWGGLAGFAVAGGHGDANEIMGAVHPQATVVWAYIGTVFLAMIFAPMCIMLLATGDAVHAIYPPNVFKVAIRVPGQYLAFYCYINCWSGSHLLRASCWSWLSWTK
jgi:hypothetical protein